MLYFKTLNRFCAVYEAFAAHPAIFYFCDEKVNFMNRNIVKHFGIYLVKGVA